MSWLRLVAMVVVLSLGCSTGQSQVHARIYISTDNGHSWERSDAGFPPKATVNDFSEFGKAIYVGTQADGVFVSRDGGRTWVRSDKGLPANVKVNAVRSTQDAVLVGTFRDGVFSSTDAGRTWLPANNGLTNTEIRRMAIHERRVFAATNGGLFVSKDSGRSWRAIAAAGKGQFNGVAVLEGSIYAADVHGVILSKDMGRTWSRVLDGATPHNVSTDGKSVFAMLYGRGLKKTNDEGATWNSAQSGLPVSLNEYTFQVVPGDEALLAGQWRGIYVSKDNGASWSLIRNGIPPGQPITEIINLGEGIMLAGAGLIPRE